MKKRRAVGIEATGPAVEHHLLAVGRGDQHGAMPVIIEHHLTERNGSAAAWPTAVSAVSGCISSGGAIRLKTRLNACRHDMNDMLNASPTDGRPSRGHRTRVAESRTASNRASGAGEVGSTLSHHNPVT